MSRFHWERIGYSTEALVDECGEIHARVSEGYGGVATWGERQFVTLAAAKKAVEQAKGMDNDLPF